jgi:predicted anti-sigma-YlaC factor YlaD
MNCRECQSLVQRLLDGERIELSPELRAHLDQCSDCRRDLAAARTLLAGMRQMPSPPGPTMPASAIVLAAERDREARRRRVWYRWYATVALAAALLLFVGFGHLVTWWQGGPMATGTMAQKNDGHIERAPAPEPRPDTAPLAQRADDAQKAVASLGRSVADKTRIHLGALLAAANPLEEIAQVDLTPLAEMEEPLDPAAHSLKQAGRSVAQTFEPVTRSARQALAYLAREIPAFDPTPNN